MKKSLQKKLLNEISSIKSTIHSRFPELSERLSTAPLFFYSGKKDISKLYFEQYLESLKMQMTACEKAGLYQAL